ncbi:MAG: hypothetical protein IPM92_08965 [Saprospiraceae bacterium]|nr:hypothetical protein [Saprospiraceae bacterium]
MTKKKHQALPSELLEKAFRLIAAKSLTDVYEENFKFVSKYVHATSRGHEVIQIALGFTIIKHRFFYRPIIGMIACY